MPIGEGESTPAFQIGGRDVGKERRTGIYLQEPIVKRAGMLVAENESVARRRARQVILISVLPVSGIEVRESIGCSHLAVHRIAANSRAVCGRHDVARATKYREIA